MPLTGCVAGMHLGVMRFFPVSVFEGSGCGDAHCKDKSGDHRCLPKGNLVHRLKTLQSDKLGAHDVDGQDTRVAAP